MDCPFDSMTMDQSVERIVDWCRGDREPRTVVTMNAGLLVLMRKNRALADACRAGDLILADGMSVFLLSHLIGRPLAERVAGIDLMAALLRQGQKKKLRVFFLGAKEDVVSSLVSQCARDYPGLTIAGYRNGYFAEADHPEVIEQIRASSADMLFIGMSSPFKETWAERHRDALGVPVLMGVGGSFDVLSGFVPRAPRFMQKLCMEWLWRLLMEPRRMWKRYLVTNTLFIKRAVCEFVQGRQS